MDMGLLAWSLSPTYKNAQLTDYVCMNRMKNGHGIISVIIVSSMPECTTHILWFPEQHKEWKWDHQHDWHHQYVSMHTYWLWLESSMRNGHWIISMITITSMPEYTTHLLWLPEQNEECPCYHQHDCHYQHASMLSSPTVIRMDMGSSL